MNVAWCHMVIIEIKQHTHVLQAFDNQMGMLIIERAILE